MNALNTQENRLPASLADAAQVLALSLLHAQPVADYIAAEQHFAEDVEAGRLYQQISGMQAELHARQHRGEITQEDLKALRALQEKFQANPVIQELAATQQAAKDYLAEINSEISGLLGVDFASQAGHCGSSCGGGCSDGCC